MTITAEPHDRLVPRPEGRRPASSPTSSGSPAPVHWGPFDIVEVGERRVARLPRARGRDPRRSTTRSSSSEAEFDAIFGRIVERGLDHWADPAEQARRRDQPRRRRPRRLLRRPRRPLPRDHHPALRQRRCRGVARRPRRAGRPRRPGSALPAAGSVVTSNIVGCRGEPERRDPGVASEHAERHHARGGALPDLRPQLVGAVAGERRELAGP